MDELKNCTGKLTTFYDTLTNKDVDNPVESIVIPKIQRDYAQGRKSAVRVRQNFFERTIQSYR